MVEINYFAVLCAAVAAMAIGALWYSKVLFGKQWMTLSGMTPEMIAEAKKKGMAKSYLLNFVGALLMAYVLAHAIVFAGGYLKLAGLQVGLTAGFWNWLGFIVPVLLAAVLWEGKSWKLYVMNVGYYLVSLLVMGTILAVWVS